MGTMKRLSRRRTLAGGGALAGALARGWPGGFAQPARAAEAVVRTVLPNGLVVIAEERRTADTVALQLAARAGSRDDGDQPGLVVMTSRMLFQGTSRRPSETDLQRAATQIGGALTRGTTS